MCVDGVGVQKCYWKKDRQSSMRIPFVHGL